MFNSADNYQDLLSQNNTHPVISQIVGQKREKKLESKEQKQELSEGGTLKRVCHLYEQLVRSHQEAIIDDIVGNGYQLPTELTHLIVEYIEPMLTSHEEAVKIVEKQSPMVVEALLKKMYGLEIYFHLRRLKHPPDAQNSIDIFRNLPQLLRQFVQKCIKERKTHDLAGISLIYADLKGMDLKEMGMSGTNFQRANLQRADLQRVYLQGVNLQGANLQGAFLCWANLQEANLRGANLQGAHLFGASLKGSDLQRAYLQKADLQRANLQEADLQGAYLQGAYLGWANLHNAKLKGMDSQGADLHWNVANLDKTIFGRNPEYVPYCTGNSNTTLLNLLRHIYIGQWWFTYRNYRKEVKEFLAKERSSLADVKDLIWELLNIIRQVKGSIPTAEWYIYNSTLYGICKFCLNYDHPDDRFEELLKNPYQIPKVNPLFSSPSASLSSLDHISSKSLLDLFSPHFTLNHPFRTSSKAGISSSTALCSLLSSSTNSASRDTASADLPFITISTS